jgi:hypothetical protein
VGTVLRRPDAHPAPLMLTLGHRLSRGRSGRRAVFVQGAALSALERCARWSPGWYCDLRPAVGFLTPHVDEASSSSARTPGRRKVLR